MIFLVACTPINWLKADSKNGQIGVSYCDKLYRLEREFKNLSPSKRRRKRMKYSKPIMDKFFQWVDASPFFGKSARAKAAEYTLNRAVGLKLTTIQLKMPSLPMSSVQIMCLST